MQLSDGTCAVVRLLSRRIQYVHLSTLSQRLRPPVPVEGTTAPAVAVVRGSSDFHVNAYPWASFSTFSAF